MFYPNLQKQRMQQMLPVRLLFAAASWCCCLQQQGCSISNRQPCIMWSYVATETAGASFGKEEL